ncbi:hypothetical protein TWF730_008006 [Orbilia blumenaviensis]|uniref:Uncharacterized protein n=1 Tax=Orbilia blumenaviensis TaxID=1796055 RepID=A0AAV9VCE3_9PEZI
MKLLGALSLSLSVLELQVANALPAVDKPNQPQKREPINAFHYVRDMDHDEVPSLDHLLAIRDAPAHVPISNTRLTPGMLLDHILDMNPTLKPAAVETIGKVEFNQYTFNRSVWNGGVADMLSHAPVTTHIKLADLENAAKPDTSDGAGAGTIQRRDPSPVMAEYRDNNAPWGGNLPAPMPPGSIFREGARDVTFTSVNLNWMARCFNRNGKYVYARLEHLREVADHYCTLFDMHMYRLAKGIGYNDIGEFSLGTVYKAVKLDDARTMRVNFQFLYQPTGYQNAQFWYPMSLFTGMQGVCHRVMRNFLSVPTMMDGCLGGSKEDTRGGWVGFDVGGKVDNRMVARWAIDPYVRKSTEHDWPDPYPEEGRTNGLPRTYPEEIYQP